MIRVRRLIPAGVRSFVAYREVNSATRPHPVPELREFTCRVDVYIILQKRLADDEFGPNEEYLTSGRVEERDGF